MQNLELVNKKSPKPDRRLEKKTERVYNRSLPWDLLLQLLS